MFGNVSLVRDKRKVRAHTRVIMYVHKFNDKCDCIFFSLSNVQVSYHFSYTRKYLESKVLEQKNLNCVVLLYFLTISDIFF